MPSTFAGPSSDLRHTAVALWMAQGATPQTGRRPVGRTSVAVTLDRYGHLFPEAGEALMNGLDAAHRAAAVAAGAGGAVVRSHTGHGRVTPVPRRPR